MDVREQIWIYCRIVISSKQRTNGHLRHGVAVVQDDDLLVVGKDLVEVLLRCAVNDDGGRGHCCCLDAFVKGRKTRRE